MSLQVPFVELGRLNQPHRRLIEEAVVRVLDSGWYILGKEGERFESEFADWLGVRHCVGVGNGLDALILVLRAWLEQGLLREGDEVLVPANTYIASILAVTANRLEPVFVEPDPVTFNLSVAGAEKALTERCKAVLAVHLYGQLADPALGDWCRERGLLLLEDCAQGHGAAWQGRKAGTFGQAGAFSFYPTKNLGALGDAGCVATDDAELAGLVRALRNYGSAAKYQNRYAGCNSRLDEIQAAILRAKLPLLEEESAARRARAEEYLAGIRHPLVRLPAVACGPESHVWHLFVVRVPDRASFQQHLLDSGVHSQVHYPLSPHHQQCYLARYGHLSLPLTEAIHREVVSLPLHPLLDAREVRQVIDAVNAWSPG
jgi:dTDP-4-amino-4,6-dideoxygalactose transaminase